MNKIIYTFCIVMLYSASLIADDNLIFFNARSENEKVIVTWQSKDEANVSKFIIERKSANSVFMEIGEMDAKGDNSLYTFTDDNAYKGDDIIFKYRLKIIDKNGQTSGHSWDISVSHTTSVGKRTWGSIKALFR